LRIERTLLYTFTHFLARYRNVALMSDERIPNRSDLAVDFHLLGRLDFNSYLRLQRRLVYEAANSDQRRITVLLCEHNELITIGRGGSRAHVRRTNEELRRAQLEVQWVNRNGGCLLHGPGQLAVYPLVPLQNVEWTVSDFLHRFQTGLRGVLEDLRISTRIHENHAGVWGRTGLLAAICVSVQDGVTCFGSALNVNPPMSHYGYIDTTAADRLPVNEPRTMSCLLAERRLPARMSTVRASMVANLAESFSCSRHHIHSGHPWLRATIGTTRERFARTC